MTELTREKLEQRGFAIVNPYGGVWCHELFETVDDAAAYLRNSWKGAPNHDLSQFRIAEASRTIELLRSPGKVDLIDIPTAP